MLKNMAVLVTGAAGTLGSATVKKLISENCKVTLMDLPSSKGKEVADKFGENAAFSPGSVTSESDVIKALDLTTQKFGYLRAVVNCASVHRSCEVFNFVKGKPMELDYFREIMEVNVVGTVNVIRLALSRMSQNPMDIRDMRGVIINTSGYGAFDGQKGQSALSASWGAISSLTLPLCRELGAQGIRVMAISPGLMDSNLTNYLPSKIINSLAALTPSPKRLGFKEEFAELVVAIMQNNFLNGEVIRLDGGLRMSF